MKHFSMAIKVDDEQTKVSKLLDNLNNEVKNIEVNGGK